ncbi:MAG TPA: hypothetical protein VNI02_07850 [Blastocatellia bacterium]|jgi:hypothetical protein|nr:hypothetical protein [Blastocatellia bacterium]
MYKPNKIITAVIALLFAVAALPGANGQDKDKTSKRDEAFDPVEFIKRFKVGMSYTEVQQALPKNVDQDILSYITTEEVFLLSVDLPTPASWNASFKFDTLDAAMRRPEKLVELSCSAGLSSRSESFESIVHKVTEAFGEPLKIDRSEDKFQQAGWRVSGGSVLTLEYSVVPNGVGNNVSVEFIIKKNPRRDSTPSKAVA